jgi:hypothetical protein
VLPCSLLVSLFSFSLFLKRDLRNMDGEQTVRISITVVTIGLLTVTRHHHPFRDIVRHHLLCLCLGVVSRKDRVSARSPSEYTDPAKGTLRGRMSGCGE